MPDNAFVKIGTALLKHQVKKLVGEETLGVISDELADIGGDKLDAWLGDKSTIEEIENAGTTARNNFRGKINDDEIEQWMAMLPIDNLPSVLEAIQELPTSPDETKLENALRESIELNWKSLSADQVNNFVNAFMSSLRSALLPIEKQTLMVIGRSVLRTEDKVDVVKSTITRSEEKIDLLIRLIENQFITSQSLTVETLKTEPDETWNLKHPYAMPPNFTGRVYERKMLVDWLNKDNESRLLILRALGGFGKSALIWYWLTHDVDSNEWTKVLWWSFYEGDSSFEHFIEETLKYLKLDIPTGQRPQVDELLKAMQSQKILLIMDGFERALRAYSNMNAAYQDNEFPLFGTDKKSESGSDCININAEIFLKGICTLPNIKSKVLMTTRLTPRAVNPREEFLLGCREVELAALQPTDAVEFFLKQKIKGTRAEIEAACEPYGYHPLSLRLLAGLVRTDLKTPYDITAALHVDISDDLVSNTSHVIETAYNKLTVQQAILLGTLAAFQNAFSIGDIKKANISFPHLETDIYVLIELGLLNYENNLYTIHPIVRQYVWSVSPRFLFGQIQGKKPALKIYPTSGPVGSNIQITGVNFNYKEAIEVSLISLFGGGTHTLSINADEYGSFQYWFSTLDFQPVDVGKWEITGQGMTSIGTDPCYFEITPAFKLKRPLRAFICYSKLDREIVRELSTKLKVQGINPWVDEEKIIPGQDWEIEIEKSINDSDVIITCFSDKSVNKPGYINKELKLALDVADRQPENTIFIIPLRFEDCTVPRRLDKLHWLDYFEPKGFEYLMRALEYRAKQLDILLV